MRRKYKFLGGPIFEASSAEELVEAMLIGHRGTFESTSHFMQEIASRCKLYNGTEISTDNSDSFVTDLKENGFLIVTLNNNLDVGGIKKYTHSPSDQLISKITSLDAFQQNELGRAGQHLLDTFWLPPFDASNDQKAFAVSQTITTFKNLGLLD